MRRIDPPHIMVLLFTMRWRFIIAMRWRSFVIWRFVILRERIIRSASFGPHPSLDDRALDNRRCRGTQGGSRASRRTAAVLRLCFHLRQEMCVLRALVLCADDFGLTDGVSRSILHLARTGRISATSAMTNRPGWKRHAGELRALDAQVGVGLHLTLTLGAPLGRVPKLAPHDRLPAFGVLMRRSLLGTLPGDEVREEIERQLAAFEAHFGRPPDFVDGHQHVHVLPGVRGPLLRALRDRGQEGRLWLRDPSDHLPSIARRGVARRKALLVRALASGFGEAARAAGFAANEGFSGFSAFDPAVPAERVFAAALSHLGPRPLVMCHPGHADAELAALDPVVATRPQEFAYLASDGFAVLLERRGLVLAPAPG